MITKQASHGFTLVKECWSMTFGFRARFKVFCGIGKPCLQRTDITSSYGRGSIGKVNCVRLSKSVAKLVIA